MKSPFFIKEFIIVSVLFFLFTTAFSQECETPFDFTDWKMEGTPDSYWRIENQNEVVDTVDIFPATFFLSLHRFIQI